jgi:hypothetical protein
VKRIWHVFCLLLRPLFARKIARKIARNRPITLILGIKHAYCRNLRHKVPHNVTFNRN